MKIVIAGVGRIGYSIAQELSKENHDITVIEQDEKRLKEVENTLDVMTLVGNAASFETLNELKLKDTDLLIAAMKEDELNMLCCLTAKKLGVRHTIARVRNRDYFRQTEFLKDDLGLTMTFNPEEDTASDISRILRFPSASKVESFANSKAESVEIRVGESSPLVNMKLYDLKLKTDANILVCAVARGKDVFIPRGDFEIKAGDRINIIGSYREINKFIKKLGGRKHGVKTVLILGGGNIAYYLAKQLANLGITIKVIEKDKKACEKFKTAFPKANVVLADGTNPEILSEEGLEMADAFVAITGDDEDNVISSMFAMSVGVDKVIAKIKESHIIRMLAGNNIDSIVQPSSIATQKIVRYVRSMQNAYDSSLDSLYYIFERKVEIMELKVNENADYLDIPIKQLKVRNDAIIASINRNGICIIPSGDDVIKAGDEVIVATTHKGITKLDKVLEA